jgi:hypothetical protein
MSYDTPPSDDDVFQFAPEDFSSVPCSNSDFNHPSTSQNSVLSVEMHLKLANLRAYLHLFGSL